MDETFGAVQAGGDLEGTIELHSRLNRAETYEFELLVSLSVVTFISRHWE